MGNFSYDDQNLHYIDVGQGPAIVFVHGTPVSSAEFAEAIEILKNNFRCIAIDHLGFGDSDKPENGDYSLTAHRKRLAALLSHLKIESAHLAVTDFGGPIALPWAVENWAQIQSLTLMNTWGWPLTETQPELKKARWLMTSWLMKMFYLKMNFSAKVILKNAWGQYRPLTKERHQYYQSKFKNAGERMGTLGFLNALFSDDPTWSVGEKLASMPPKPTQIIWGMADGFIKTTNLNRWIQIFSDAEVHKLEKVGHFVSEEAPQTVANLLQKFIGNK